MLSKKFTAFAGVQQTWIQNLNQFQLNHDGKLAVMQTNSSYLLWYGGGIYQVNPKIRLSGLVWKQTDQQSVMQRKTESPNFDAQGFQIYMNYQISDNVQINASFIATTTFKTHFHLLVFHHTIIEVLFLEIALFEFKSNQDVPINISC
jgi:hypothetical protein